MVKLAVGARDVSDIERYQQERGRANPPLRHLTRSTPKRAEEITGGGSLYWVVNGVIQVRQRITAITAEKMADGSACAGLVLHPELIRVAPRVMKPFQGWRYLNATEAPPDLATLIHSGIDALPDAMRAALSELALI